MGRLTRYTILLALSFSCASFCVPANSQTNLQNKAIKKPTGSVSGRVTVKGKPKGGIIVGVRTGEIGPQVGPLRKAVTDADGNYRVTDLPAGTYRVGPMASAFIVPDSTPGRLVKSVMLEEGENVDGLDFSMLRGGVITGRVSQADGRPVIEERITITAADEVDRSGQPGPPGLAGQTDDRGVYRVYGLPAGKYKVFVGQGADTFPGPQGQARHIYERVYYPDVTNSSEARVVELGEGSEAANIDITVGESRKGVAVAGVVIDSETNQPLANLRFGLQKVIPDRIAGYFGTPVLSDRLGAFRFENVAPGKYSVISMPQTNSDVRVDAVTFEVTDRDLTGLTLKGSKGASVSGRVVLEGTNDLTVQNNMTRLSVAAYVPTAGTGGGFVQPSAIAPDLTFRVGGLQEGIAQFRLTARDPKLLTGFSILRVERDGVVNPRGIEIKSGEQVVGVKLVVVYGSGIVRGTIKVENGPLPEGGRFMVRLAKPEAPSGMVGRSQEVDARGRFIIEGIPAGSYDLFAYVYIPGSRSRQPYSKQSVTVSEGSVVDVEAVIDLHQDQPAKP